MQGAYAFEEGWGWTVRDSSGKFHDGNLRNGSWAEGKSGRGLQLKYDTVMVAPSFQAGGEVTIAAWVKRSSAEPDLGGFLTHWAGGTNRALNMSAADWYGGVSSAHVSGNNGNRPAGRAPLPIGEWSHLAATYDSKYCRLYINGELVAWTPWEAGFTGPSELILGGPLSNLHAMVVDDVRTYNAALTPLQIKSLAGNPAS